MSKQKSKRSTSKKESKKDKNADVDMEEQTGTYSALKVDEMRNRAQIRLHGVDNHSTYEHPTSFTSITG